MVLNGYGFGRQRFRNYLMTVKVADPAVVLLLVLVYDRAWLGCCMWLSSRTWSIGQFEPWHDLLSMLCLQLHGKLSFAGIKLSSQLQLRSTTS